MASITLPLTASLGTATAGGRPSGACAPPAGGDKSMFQPTFLGKAQNSLLSSLRCATLSTSVEFSSTTCGRERERVRGAREGSKSGMLQVC